MAVPQFTCIKWLGLLSYVIPSLGEAWECSVKNEDDGYSAR